MSEPAIASPADQTIVVQDDRCVSRGQLQAAGRSIARQLCERSCERLAITTRRADVVMATLIGCEARGADLVLLRDSTTSAPELLDALAVDACLEDDLVVSARPAPRGSPAAGNVYLCSSGTTGRPKVAQHSRAALLGRIRRPADGQSAVWLLTYHPASFAGLQVILTALTGSARLIACAENSVASLAVAASRHGATHISGTPTLWRALVPFAAGTASVSIVRQITLGGEAVDQATLDLLRRTFPDASIRHIYASTEAGALFAVKDGRAGFPAAWLESGIDEVGLRIRAGALEVFSPRAMTRYAAGSTTSVRTDDGWIRTGDVVRVEGDRVLFVGRSDSIINVGGAKVSPEEVEAVVLQLSGVRDVRVYGVRNPITGALVAADVVKVGGETDDAVRGAIVQHLQSRLESYKVPRVIRFVAEISANASGKKDRSS